MKLGKRRGVFHTCTYFADSKSVERAQNLSKKYVSRKYTIFSIMFDNPAARKTDIFIVNIKKAAAKNLRQP